MFVVYCDLCLEPLKNNRCYSLYITSVNSVEPVQHDNIEDYYKDYDERMREVAKEMKVICPDCKKLFDKIFEYRKQNLAQLTQECEDLYNPHKKIDEDSRGNK